MSTDVYNIQLGRTILLSTVSIDGGAMLSQTPDKLYIVRENTQTLTVTGLYDNDAQAYWTGSATVNATLLDEFGNIIITFPVPYLPGSSGVFLGDFGDQNFLPNIGRGYTMVIKGSFNGKALSVPLLAEVMASPFFTGIITGGGRPIAPASAIKNIYQANTQDITVNGLQDVDTGAYLNAATLTATLYDPNGVAVPGCTNIALPLMAGSVTGDYQGFFGSLTFMPPLGSGYNLIISGNQGSVYIEITYPATVVVRNQ